MTAASLHNGILVARFLMIDDPPPPLPPPAYNRHILCSRFVPGPRQISFRAGNQSSHGMFKHRDDSS